MKGEEFVFPRNRINWLLAMKLQRVCYTLNAAKQKAG